MANVLVNRSNSTGIPLLLVQSITAVGTDFYVNFNNHVNIRQDFTGLLLIKFPEVVNTSTNPVYFNTLNVAGSNTALYDNSGNQCTLADLTSTTNPTYHLVIYDSVSNRLQLIA